MLAQNPDLPATITWGDELKAPQSSFLTKIITQDKDGFYVLRRQRKDMFSTSEKIYIERYDHNQKLKRSEKIDLKCNIFPKITHFQNILL